MSGTPLSDRIRRAADNDGIGPGGPLYELSEVLAEMADELQEDFRRVAGDARKVAEAEIERCRAAVGLAEAAARRAEATTKEVEVRHAEALADLVDRLVPELAEKVGGALVIRERARSARARFGWMVLGAALLAGVAFAGDRFRAMRTGEAVAFMDRCKATAKPAADGNLYCATGARREGR